jgi:hypothetical protein
MRKTGQRMSCQAVNRDKLIEGLSFKILSLIGTLYRIFLLLLLRDVAPLATSKVEFPG